MKNIAAKNDDLRSQLPSLPYPHRFVTTQEVRALGAFDLQRVIEAVKKYDDFTEENDPYKEHDWIFAEVDGRKYMCKIDYYDNEFEGFEEDGNRVFTLMRASEY